VRIANGDVEEGLGGLDNADARLRRSGERITGRRFDRRRDSSFGGGDVVIVVLQADVAHQRLERGA
jgi:hypothetical protein